MKLLNATIGGQRIITKHSSTIFDSVPGAITFKENDQFSPHSYFTKGIELLYKSKTEINKSKLF